MKAKEKEIFIGADMTDDSEPTTEEWAADSSPSKFYAMMGPEAQAVFDKAKKRIAKNQATLKGMSIYCTSPQYFRSARGVHAVF